MRRRTARLGKSGRGTAPQAASPALRQRGRNAAKPTLEFDIVEAGHIHYARNLQKHGRPGCDSGIAGGGRNHSPLFEPRKEDFAVDTAGITEVTGLSAGQGGNPPPVILDFAHEFVPVGRRAVPVCVQLDRGSPPVGTIHFGSGGRARFRIRLLRTASISKDNRVAMSSLRSAFSAAERPASSA